MTRTFIRLPEFEKQCMHLGLDEDDVREVENALLENPTVGKIMRGTGGLRKVRIALKDTGKSGGARVIYVDFAFYGKIYLITAYAKSEFDGLSQAKQTELKILTFKLKKEAERG